MEQLLSLIQPVGTIGSLVILGFLMFERLVEKGYLKIGKNGNGHVSTPLKEATSDMRNALQPLLLKMDQLLGEQGTLAGHFNHDTTELLGEIRDELKNGFGDMRAKHKEWDILGIPTRECKKN